MSKIDLTNDLTYEDKRFMAALISVKFMGKIALTKATADQKALKRDIEAFDGSAILTGNFIFIRSSCYYAFTICSNREI